jgi:hypothetical protein
MFRQSTVVLLSLWMQNTPVRQYLRDGKSNESRPLAPFFAQCKHDGQKQSRQRSKEGFGNRETVESSQSLAGQNESGVRHRCRPKNYANQIHKDHFLTKYCHNRVFAGDEKIIVRCARNLGR